MTSAASSAVVAPVSMRTSGSLGRLVGRVDAGEVGELAAAGLGVEALRVALLGDLERRVDEDLDELAVARRSSRASRRSARNGEMNDTSTMRPASTISAGDLGDAADVLDAVGVGEAEVAVEAVADVVAVEQVGVHAERVQLATRRGWRSSTCPAPDRPVNHTTPGRWPLERGAGVACRPRRPASGRCATGAARSAAARRRR